MKRAVWWVLGLAVLVVTIVMMAEVTQNRPDEVRAGSRTTVSFTVSTRDVQRGEPAAAAALWAVCAGTVGGDISPIPDLVVWRVAGDHRAGDRRTR